jgi:phage-related protein
MQNGEKPVCSTRPLPSIGQNVFELKDGDESTWYRLMYLAKVDDVIYVLHCFEKDSTKIPKRDLELAESRLKEVKAEITRNRARMRKGEPHGTD